VLRQALAVPGLGDFGTHVQQCCHLTRDRPLLTLPEYGELVEFLLGPLDSHSVVGKPAAPANTAVVRAQVLPTAPTLWSIAPALLWCAS
jgi:hypothetical protein